MPSDKDLDELDALLLSIPEEAGGMLLPELDGFFAGLVVSPEMILPGELLPHVWDANGTGSPPRALRTSAMTSAAAPRPR